MIKQQEHENKEQVKNESNESNDYKQNPQKSSIKNINCRGLEVYKNDKEICNTIVIIVTS